MVQAKKPAFSNSEKLQVIEKFAVQVAQSIVGGEVTRPNHPAGDLYHAGREVFFEVKASGLSAGVIIVKEQINYHMADLEHHDHQHIFVFYKNRDWHEGKSRCLPFLKGRTAKRLENFLIAHLREIQIAHVTVIKAIYKKRRKKDERMYVMQSGPKTYLKIPPGQIRELVAEPQRLKKFGLDPNDYVFKKEPMLVRFNGKKIPVLVYQITLI